MKKLYKVITVEIWENQKTTSEYEFQSILSMLQFLKMCKDDDIKLTVAHIKSKNKIAV
jgi:uncharacterized protein (DUF952 family)